MSVGCLFSDAKVRKEYVEHVLHINPTEDAAHGYHGAAQVFSCNLALVRVLQEPLEAREALDEVLAVALARDDRAVACRARRELEPSSR